MMYSEGLMDKEFYKDKMLELYALKNRKPQPELVKAFWNRFKNLSNSQFGFACDRMAESSDPLSLSSFRQFLSSSTITHHTCEECDGARFVSLVRPLPRERKAEYEELDDQEKKEFLFRFIKTCSVYCVCASPDALERDKAKPIGDYWYSRGYQSWDNYQQGGPQWR